MYDERDKNVIDNANVTITDAEETKQEQKEASGMNTEEARNYYYDEYYRGAQYQQAQETGKKKRTSRSGLKRVLKKGAALIVSAAVFGVVAGAGFQGVQYLVGNNEEAQATTIGTTNTTVSNSDSSGQTMQTDSGSGTVVTDVSDIVENVLPSIVAINCTAVGTTYDWFGRPYQNEEYGSGSGIIIGQNDDEILIVTNNHVVDSATSVEIVFDDDSTAAATIKGTDSSSDLAVVAVNVSDLSEDTLNHIKIATLGSSSEMKPGQLVIAIGNALGYGQSVTVGYVSALDREVTVDGVTMTLLQTDAAINPGNSGGALLNANGEVIGINSVKYASEDVEGIGFAIPVDSAIPIINELMNREILSEGEVGFLGIYETEDITSAYSEAFNMPIGIYVRSVVEDSPAAQAGVTTGYIITGFNGRTVETREELQEILSYTRAGTEITLEVQVLENGTYVQRDLTITLANRPEE